MKNIIYILVWIGYLLPFNTYAQGIVLGIGNNSFGEASPPIGLNDIKMVSAGFNYSLALKANGTVVGWGNNSYGKIDIPNSLNNVKQIIAGNEHSLALKSDGTLVAWGDNNFGQLNVPNGLNNIKEISSNGLHTLALKADGIVIAWGYNGYGQTNIPVGLNNIKQISGGLYHSLALKSNGTVVAWGSNLQGQTNLPPNLSNVKNIVAGYSHSLALKADGTVVAWGYNANGACNVPVGLNNVIAISAGNERSYALKADGTMVSWGLPITIPTNLNNITHIDAEGNHCLVIQANTSIVGWGNNYFQQTTIPPNLNNSKSISGGEYHSIALKSNGSITLWGSVQGNDITILPANLDNVVSIESGYNHSVALKADGTVVAWGYNSNGQTNVPIGLNNVIKIIAGYEHSLALKADGTVVAWGYNSNGQTNVPIGINNVTNIAAGYGYSIVQKANGTVQAWGDALFGQIAVPTNLNNVISIASGDNHSLALKSDGTLVGWGLNSSGQTTIPINLNNVCSIVGGGNHSLALKTDGTVIAWGLNTDGYGTFVGQSTVPSGLNNVTAISAGETHSLALSIHILLISPTSLTTTNGTCGIGIPLNWTDASTDETGFEVWRATAANGTYTLLTTTNPNTTTYTDNNSLVIGTTYYYKVRAKRGSDFSAYTNTVSGQIIDNQAPNFTAPLNKTANTTLNLCTTVVTGLSPTSISDNCDSVNITYILSGATTGNGNNDASGQTFNKGITTITYTATDASGNTKQENFTVTVTDTQLPTLTAPANKTANTAINACSAVVSGLAPTFSDNCSGVLLAYTFSGATVGNGNGEASGQTFNKGITTVTYTATDASGNSKQASFTINVIDNILPTITAPNNVVTQSGLGTCVAIVNNIDAIATDNCNLSNIAYTFSGATSGNGLGTASGMTFNKGITTITYTATDASGNSKQASFTITVNDTQPPNFTVPANVSTTTSSCSKSIANIGTTNTTDNCAGVVNTTYSFSGATIKTGTIDASGSVFNVGITTITYTATDLSGNNTSKSFTVTLTETTPPTLSVPANKIVEASAGTCTATVTGLVPTTSDNCGGVVSLAYQLTGATIGTGNGTANGLVFNKGVTTIQYTATDISGNSQTASMTVTVNDTQLPTITVPTHQVVNTLPTSCHAVVNSLAPIATDNCSISTITYILTGATTGNGNNEASGLVFNKGITTVTYTATDASGNSKQASFTVTVNDTTLPVLTVPNPVLANTAANLCTAVANGLTPTASDNCSGAITITYLLSGATTGNGANDASGLTFNKGITTVTYTAKDASNNVNNKSFTVTVNDTQKPDFQVPNNQTIASPTCTAIVNDIAPTTITDNCTGILAITYTLTGATTGNGANEASGLTFNQGITTVTYTAKDASDNTTSKNFTVTVNDTQKPTLTLPAVQGCTLANLPAYTTLAQLQSAGGSATDNCALNPNSLQMINQTATATGYTRTYQIADFSGNTQEAIQTLTLLQPKPNFRIEKITEKTPLKVRIFNQTVFPTSSAGTFYWDFGNGNTFVGYDNIPEQVYFNDTDDKITYTISLRIVTPQGCEETKPQTILVDPLPCEDKIQVPNAFTPISSANLNDTFRPVFLTNIEAYHFQIFNRAGQLVFETKEKDKGWDGKFGNETAEAGKYIFKLYFRCTNGRGESYKNGGFVLIR